MRLILIIGVFYFSITTDAQLVHPKISPLATITQDIGLSTITIEYSRPSVQGRSVFGSLVPYGRIWRVGANESTKFTTDSDIDILGNTLAKGTYALYAFPDSTHWEVVFHKNISHWGDGREAYDPGEDVFRITVIPDKIPYLQENFLISFEKINHNSATMLWTWEQTKIAIPITIDTDSKMQHQIAAAINKTPTAQTYYEAARYLEEQKVDYPKALHYVNKALELGGDTYYFHRVKSLIEAAMENYAQAIISAKKSLELSQKEGKDEFVRMNEQNIRHWANTLKRSKK